MTAYFSHAAKMLPACFLLTGAFAQNDECATALAVTPGVLAFDTSTATTSPEPWPCAFNVASDLWYSYSAATNTQVILSLCGSSYDTTLEVFSGTCAALVSLGCNDDACGLQSEIAFNATQGATYLFRIGGYNGQSGSGTLTVTLMAPLGPEDECAGALPLTNGSTPFSTIGSTTSAPGWPCAAGGSDIWFAFTAAGAQVDIDTFGSGYDTALEAFSGACGNLISLDCNDDSGGGLQSALSLSTAAGQTYYLRVGGFASYQGSGVLNVTGAGNPPNGTIGTPFCNPGNANSTGAPGVVIGTGSAVAADNDLTLEASDLPLNSFGFFITSPTQGITPNPGGSQGVLCLGGAIGRYVGAGQIKNTGATGTFSLLLNLTQIPTPSGFVAALAGQTRSFQAWHRDAVGGAATSNFTHGLVVTFL